MLNQIEALVVDKDAKVSKFVKNYPGCEHIQFYYDPGHYKKNFKRSLIGLFGKGKTYQHFPENISRWFMWIIKRSEGEKYSDETFRDLWCHTYTHYTQKICYERCPCLEDAIPIAVSWNVETENYEGFSENVILNIFRFLDNESFGRFSEICRTFFRLSLSSEIRRFRIKPDDMYWLNEKIPKQKVIIYGKKNASNQSKRMGLIGLLRKIFDDRKMFLHRFHTTMNESLFHKKIGEGSNKKRIKSVEFLKRTCHILNVFN